MADTSFTKEQQWAIEAHGGSILVSAAAGSGKTTVLIARIMRMLTLENDPVDADRLLVVTFTKAAAGEMRSRLNAAINERIKAEPANDSLRRQKLLLTKAHITTIDSFCASCLREFFAAADVAPDFRIAEEGDISPIKTDILDRLIEERFAQPDEAFSRLVGLAGSGGALIKLIDELSRFASSYPEPDVWLKNAAAAYDGTAAPEDTPWGAFLIGQCAERLRYLIKLSDRALQTISLDDTLYEKYYPVYADERERLGVLLELAEQRRWNELYRAASGFEFENMGKHRCPDVPGKAEAKKDRDLIKKVVNGENSIASWLCPQESFENERKRLAPVIACLCELATEYRKRLYAEKQERKILAFDDLKRLTAGLLFTRDGSKYLRTPIARELSSRFEEILIDEYQDTDYTQDLIFRAISREDGDEIGDGTNMFMVGDIKQSIYGFRRAEPKIFLDRLDRFAPYRPENTFFPAKISLGSNFRSRVEITGAVNMVFSQLMCRERGGIDYNDDQFLIAGGSFPECEGRETELHVLSGSAVADDDDSRDLLEARYCARLIDGMISEGFQVTKNGGLVPIRYEDICILRRGGVKDSAGVAFLTELGELGIPVRVKTDKGFFATPEIRTMLSFLRAVNNPLLDIPLLAALRSPIFGFDCDKLTEIRAADRSASIYACLNALATNGDRECASVLSTLEALRADAAAMTSDRFISAVYRKTGYLAAVQAGEGGEGARRNLLSLAELAASYESSGYRGLAGFIEMTDKKLARGDDLPCADPETEQNRVTVCTMHVSKGLQYPVCILTGFGSRRNAIDERKTVVKHGTLGIGASDYNAELRSRFDTTCRQAVSIALANDSVNEELRVLYVAMTRAIDKLIMVATTEKNSDSEALSSRNDSLVLPDGISPYAVGETTGYGRWILACAYAYKEGLAKSIPGCETRPIRVIPVDAESEMLAKNERASAPEETAAMPDPKLTAMIRERFGYSYPYNSLRAVPSKVTASATHARSGEYSLCDARPSFTQSGGLAPNERGTAMHRFMECCDLSRAAADPAAEVARLTAEGILSGQESAVIDLAQIKALFEGALGKLISQAKRTEREWRFTVPLEKRFLPLFCESEAPDDTIVLQGECDLLLIMEDEAIIVDYKTDRVSALETLVERYRAQLDLYSSAVRQITGLPVRRCYIYSFALNREIALDY